MGYPLFSKKVVYPLKKTKSGISTLVTIHKTDDIQSLELHNTESHPSFIYFCENANDHILSRTYPTKTPLHELKNAPKSWGVEVQ